MTAGNRLTRLYDHPPGGATCPVYGGPYCTYPWFASNSAAHAITYGADYPGTRSDYGQGSQFATTPLCGGPFGADSTYCDTVLTPSRDDRRYLPGSLGRAQFSVVAATAPVLPMEGAQSPRSVF